MKEIEIEKRYLITKEKAEELLRSNENTECVQMIDYYIPNGRNHMDLRLRKKGDEYYITRKTPVEEGVMAEYTIKINAEEFMELSKGLVNDVAKTRYGINYLGYKAELDIYEGRHSGLNFLEIEFPNKDEFKKSSKIISSDERLEDVTGIEKYAAGKLAEK